MNPSQDGIREAGQLDAATMDEGGLRPPPELRGWRRAWWWFDFLILVKLARLRFIGILVVIGVIITQWDTLAAYYDKWTRPASDSAAVPGGGKFEWFCPMHPTIIRDNPKDKCPICFMDLARRVKGTGKPEVLPAGVVSRVQLTPYRVVLAGVQTVPVEKHELSREIRAIGYVEFNERSYRTVAARVAGRVDRLMVNETGITVQEGQPLAELYSPDLLVTVQNLLDAKKAGNTSYLENARTRLELLGVEGDQVDEILESGKADTHIVVRSPIGGHVIRKEIREGQYVEEGTPLFEVADLSTVWIEAQVYEEDLGALPLDLASPGSHGGFVPLEIAATTPSVPGTEFHGRVAFVLPHADPMTRTVTVRLEIDNPSPHLLRPGSTADVVIRVRPTASSEPVAASEVSQVAEQAPKSSSDELAEGMLAVPESAVIDTGRQKIVYRERSPGVFDGVEVKLGPKMVDSSGVSYFPVLDGLQAGEQIVTTGSFLIDAETRLNPAAGSIYFGGGGATGAGSQVIRATTPDDLQAKIEAALAALTPGDREKALAQRFCAVLDNSRLGSMGTPVKLDIEGETVFVCCSACKSKALEDPAKTKQAVEQLREQAPETNP